MAQSGFTPIQLYRSSTAATAPSAVNLADGELALNLTDEKLYFKNAGGVVTLLASAAGAEGTVTSVALSGGTTGLTVSGSPITTSGTITLAGTLAIANGGTGATDASGARTALGLGSIATQNSNSVTITGGSISGITDLAVADGGTGASDASGARTNLGATTVGGNFFTLTNPSAIRFIRVNADNTVSALSDADFRTAIGAGTGTGTVTSVALSGGTTGLTVSGSPITTSGTITLAGTLAIANGGTGATSATNARSNLGLGSMATQNSSSVTITGGSISGITDLAVADGGTGASDASGARTNLGATTVGANIFTLTNPSAITFLRLNADNTVSALDAATFRTAIGAGTGNGTVTSVGGTGTVNGLTLTGTVTSSGNLTLGGTLSGVDLTSAVTGTLPVANGGTGTATAFTAGSVVFAGASGVYTQDNANLFWDDTNNRLGIGTSSPGAKLNIVDNSASDAVRITQTGAGNALVVEDSANPDATPFVVRNNGQVLVRQTSDYSISGGDFAIQASSTGGANGNSGYAGYNWANNGFANGVSMFKSRGNSLGTQGIVGSGDALGAFRAYGSDGIAFIEAASITCAVDGTPGANDMPGRLVFSTTADGAASPTERMRIDSSGNVGIGTSAPGFPLEVNGETRASKFTTSAGTQSLANNTDLTILTVTGSAPRVWIVCMAVDAAGGTDQTVALVVGGNDGSGGPSLNVTQLANGTNTDVSVSGGNINVKQTTGTTQTVSWSITRIM